MKVNFKLTQRCPKCGNQNIQITDVCVLFEDSRMETVQCVDCFTMWKLYYKVADCFAEILEPRECACKNNGEDCACEKEAREEKIGIPVTGGAVRGQRSPMTPHAHNHAGHCNHSHADVNSVQSVDGKQP